jgi:hypothetical protein
MKDGRHVEACNLLDSLLLGFQGQAAGTRGRAKKAVAIPPPVADAESTCRSGLRPPMVPTSDRRTEPPPTKSTSFSAEFGIHRHALSGRLARPQWTERSLWGRVDGLAGVGVVT